MSTPTPEHPKVRTPDGCELPEEVSPGCLLLSSVPGGGWTRGCKRTVVLGGTALGGIGTVVITTGLGCSGGFRVGRALPEGR